MEPALHGLGKRVPLIDLKFFITALILQRQTGTNMVAVLENLSSLVRERLNLAAKLKAHTAQQRFSAGLLCCLPLVPVPTPAPGPSKSDGGAPPSVDAARSPEEVSSAMMVRRRDISPLARTRSCPIVSFSSKPCSPVR